MKLTSDQRAWIRYLRDQFGSSGALDIHVTVHIPGPRFDWVPWGNLDHRSAHDRTAPRKHNDEEADV